MARPVKVYSNPNCPVPLTQSHWEFKRLLNIFHELKPSRILEIGSEHGGSLWHWITNAAPGSTIVAVDYLHAEGTQWRPQQLRLRDRWERWAKEARVNLHIVNADSTQPDTIEAVRKLAPFDFAFIDANHRYEYVRPDFLNYGRGMVRDGGVVALHDLLPSSIDPHGIQVHEFWRQIVAAGYVTQELYSSPQQRFSEFNNKVGFGIGVVYIGKSPVKPELELLAPELRGVAPLSLPSSPPHPLSEMWIPKVFHRIWIGPAKIPDEHLAWGESWLKCNPGWTMKFWTNENLPAIRNKRVFDLWHEWSGKADVLRMELIYNHGGVYIDTDYECFRNIEPLLLGHDHFFTRESDNVGESVTTLSNAMFGATPHHPLLKMLIEGVDESWDKGWRWTALAGPAYFTRKLMKRPDIFMLPREIVNPYYNVPNEKNPRRGPLNGDTYAAHYWAFLGR